MKDIFDNTILCSGCDKPMKPGLLKRNGFNLRAVSCGDCGESIIHPQDKLEFDEFMRLKKKDFEVKMRLVGNSYAVSIPREIVSFMREQEKMVDDMVRLSFEGASRLSLSFNTPNADNSNSRVVSSKEVRVVRDGKPVYHEREFSDSANPQRNKKVVFNAEDKK